jgi:hypothetical protein
MSRAKRTLTINIRRNGFADVYEQLTAYKIPLGEANRKKVKVGTIVTPRICRVCKRSTDEGATFKKYAHIVPQALGNRELVSVEECDACNSSAGMGLENDLITFLSLQRATLPLRTKKGGCAKHKLKGGDNASYIFSEPDGKNIIIQSDPTDDSVQMKYDLAIKEFSIVAKILPFSMMKVAKSLGRIAFLALPSSEVTHYDAIRVWYRGEAEYSPFFVRTNVSSTGLVDIWLIIYKRRYHVVGEAPLVVAMLFGMNAYCCYLPGPTFALPLEIMLPAYPPAANHPALRQTAEVWLVRDDAPIKGNTETFIGSFKEIG